MFLIQENKEWQPTILKRFCLVDSKKILILFLPHLEPKLKLFEVDDIGDDIYIMVKCVLFVCHEKWSLSVCL